MTPVQESVFNSSIKHPSKSYRHKRARLLLSFMLAFIVLRRSFVLFRSFVLCRSVVLCRSRCFVFCSLIGSLICPFVGSLIGSLICPLVVPLLSHPFGRFVVVEFTPVVLRVSSVVGIF